MFFNFRKRAYVKAMRDAAKSIAPSNDACEKMLGSVFLAAGLTAAGVTFASASSKAASMAKLALIKTVGVAAAVTVGVTAAGTTLLAPPSIKNIVVQEKEPYSESEILIKTGGNHANQTVVVIPEEGTPLSAIPTADGQYVVSVTRNGQYTVEVTGPGGLSASSTVEVESVDMDIPLMEKYYEQDGLLYIHFSDAKSGVKWESVYGMDQADNRVMPVRYSAEEGYVVFEAPDADMQIYLQDNAGNWATSAVRIY